MKVIQYPPSDENWSVKMTCSGWGHNDDGCGARLKVYREDLRYTEPTPEKEIGAVTFRCMCCGALTDVGLDKRPERVKELRPYKRKWLMIAEQKEPRDEF